MNTLKVGILLLPLFISAGCVAGRSLLAKGTIATTQGTHLNFEQYLDLQQKTELKPDQLMVFQIDGSDTIVELNKSLQIWDAHHSWPSPVMMSGKIMRLSDLQLPSEVLDVVQALASTSVLLDPATTTELDRLRNGSSLPIHVFGNRRHILVGTVHIVPRSGMQPGNAAPATTRALSMDKPKPVT